MINKKSLTIEVQVELGTVIHKVVEEAVALSKRMDVNVRFTFNSVKFFVAPYMTVDTVMQKWEKATTAA